MPAAPPPPDDDFPPLVAARPEVLLWAELACRHQHSATACIHTSVKRGSGPIIIGVIPTSLTRRPPPLAVQHDASMHTPTLSPSSATRPRNANTMCAAGAVGWSRWSGSAESPSPSTPSPATAAAAHSYGRSRSCDGGGCNSEGHPILEYGVSDLCLYIPSGRSVRRRAVQRGPPLTLAAPLTPAEERCKHAVEAQECRDGAERRHLI